MTLEDETGAVDVIVWPQVVERQRQPLLAATLLTVYGVWQKEDEVMRLVAKTVVDDTAQLHGLGEQPRLPLSGGLRRLPSRSTNPAVSRCPTGMPKPRHPPGASNPGRAG